MRDAPNEKFKAKCYLVGKPEGNLLLFLCTDSRNRQQKPSRPCMRLA